jgi:hypothetical protein
MQTLPTFRLKFRNRYDKKGFQLDKYAYADTLELHDGDASGLNAPNRLTYVEPDSKEVNTLTFRPLPNALVDVHEPNKFMLRYLCEGNSKLGFHLNAIISVSKRQDNPALIESFGLEIEMRYIGGNLRQTMSNSGIRYRARIFKRDDKYYIKDYTSEIFGDEPESGFSMQIEYPLKKTNPQTSPEFNLHIEITPKSTIAVVP